MRTGFLKTEMIYIDRGIFNLNVIIYEVRFLTNSWRTNIFRTLDMFHNVDSTSAHDLLDSDSGSDQDYKYDSDNKANVASAPARDLNMDICLGKI